MPEHAASDAVTGARDAVSRGDWRAAFELFERADRDGAVALADVPVFAEVAYASGHLEMTIVLWERAYAELSGAGETVSAAGAAVRVAMHLLFDMALMAPVRGWLARAEQLLDDAVVTPGHAWLAVVRSYERMLSGDREAARTWADRAVEWGSSCDPAAAAIGRVAAARLVVLDGDVEYGLALLDEAGVAATSGDLDPLSTGVVYCELVCALQGLAQYDAAEEWTEAMERWARTNAIGSVHGRCRVHRAEILRLRGRCDEAEAEVLQACDELRPYLRRELGWPLSELGRIRLHRGNLAGAEEALVAAHHAGWDAQPGLAQMLVARGDLAQAAASIRRALESPSWVPSKELPPATDLRRAPLLEAQVTIAVATGDVDRARSAAVELERIATRFRSKALAASAVQAWARVHLADDDALAAESLFAEAIQLWDEIGAPYETAMARAGLADACRANDDEDRADLEQQAASAILARLKAGGDGAAAFGARPVALDAVDDIAPNSFRRHGEFWSVTFDRRTVQLRDSKGMRHLARLLACPGRELHVLDLVATEAGEPGPGEGAAGELLDARAKNGYRRRLEEIEADLEEARAGHDLGREAQAEAEREFLVRELSRAVGLGGRDRRAGVASERARAGVTRAVRQAIARTGEHHPQLAEHLGRTIRTGTYCAYLPDPRAPVDWSL